MNSDLSLHLLNTISQTTSPALLKDLSNLIAVGETPEEVLGLTEEQKAVTSGEQHADSLLHEEASMPAEA